MSETTHRPNLSPLVRALQVADALFGIEFYVTNQNGRTNPNRGPSIGVRLAETVLENLSTDKALELTDRLNKALYPVVREFAGRVMQDAGSSLNDYLTSLGIDPKAEAKLVSEAEAVNPENPI